MKLNKEKLETQITDGVDERVKQANDSALAAVGIVSIFCVLISLLYRLYTDQNPLPDLISVVVMMITYTVVNSKNHIYDIPRSFTGKTLDTGTDKKSRKSRIKFYALDSLVFAAMFTVIDLVVDTKFSVSSAVLDVVIGFAVSMVIDYLLHGHTIKKYNKYIDTLENDDDEENE